MPLKLHPPNPKKGRPNFTIRGTYLRTEVYQTTGTDVRKLAREALAKVEREIERGTFRPAKPTLDFFSAAISYVAAGGQDTYVDRLKDYFREKPVDEIDQAAIDTAATLLYPNATAATRNRHVYTPVSAILKHAGREKPIKRPKGARGQRRLCWLTPPQAFALLAAARSSGDRFWAYCTFLLYTGCRLSEALRLQGGHLDLAAGYAYIPDTKNGEPRAVHLPPVLVAALANLKDKEKSVFGYAKSGALYGMLDAAATSAGVDLPPRVAFHIFRHTYGAWMRRHGHLDTSGLVATGAWKSHDAARIYEHVEVSEEARKSNLMPTPPRFDGAKAVQSDDDDDQVIGLA